MPVARSLVTESSDSSVRIVFIDDAASVRHVNGHDVLTFDEFLAEPANGRFACVAIAASDVRQRLSLRLSAAGISPWPIVASQSVVMDDVSLGEGAIICPFVTLTSNISIGAHFHANIYSYVAHDCRIGDFVTFAPGVKCNGNVVIEDHAYLGTGAIVRQGTPSQPLVIGRGAIVGAGAVVTRDVPPGTTVIGSPARPMQPRPAT
jgi:sugar O-acyltransferase (sialic acid O-acetyltransferase NeuD family)